MTAVNTCIDRVDGICCLLALLPTLGEKKHLAAKTNKHVVLKYMTTDAMYLTQSPTIATVDLDNVEENIAGVLDKGGKGEQWKVAWCLEGMKAFFLIPSDGLFFMVIIKGQLWGSSNTFECLMINGMCLGGEDNDKHCPWMPVFFCGINNLSELMEEDMIF